MTLKSLLADAGLTQVELARGIGRSEAMVSRLLSGDTGASQETISAILALLSKRMRRRVTYEECFGSPVAASR